MFSVRNISQWELRAGNKYPSFPSPSVGLFWGWPPILSQKVHTHFEFRLYSVVTSVTQPFGPPSLCFLYLPTPSLCFLQYSQRNDLSWSFVSGYSNQNTSLPKTLIYTWGDGGNKAKKKVLLLRSLPSCGSRRDEPSKIQRQTIWGLLQST